MKVMRIYLNLVIVMLTIGINCLQGSYYSKSLPDSSRPVKRSTALTPNWSRTECIGNIASSFQNGTWIPPEYFALSPTSVSNSNYALTIPGCRALCGKPGHKSWNRDAGVRLLTWLLPIVLMVVNVPLPNVGLARFATIVILLGNPVGFLWGMLLEIEIWAAALRMARKMDVGNRLLMCLGRVIAIHQGTRRDPCILQKPSEVEVRWRKRLKLLPHTETQNIGGPHNIQQRLRSGVETCTSVVEVDKRYVSSRQQFRIDFFLQTLDSELADLQRTDFLRAVFTSTIYILLTMAGFTSKLSDGSPGSGGKIGPAIVLAFILVAVGLSNAVGELHIAACEKVFNRFFARANCYKEELIRNTSQDSHVRLGCLQRQKESTPRYHTMAWSGGMPAYRPCLKAGTCGRFFKLSVLSVAPLGIAFAAAMIIIATPPVYFTCRAKLILGILCLWLFSAIIGCGITWAGFASGKYLFGIHVTKDAMIATINLVFIILASSGWGNTCECWGGATGIVHLNPVKTFDFNNNVLYPSTVGACFVLQILTGVVILISRWPAYRMMRKPGSLSGNIGEEIGS
ncbi:hypothetical protein CC78DRAFT_568121 [Lojkania enalia]|uniref:Uncharacterized protein n=1 Tax=Lojkania enalia TaxID=147567 RepID=A0A9P4KAB6_9PLEO|nr:hypothetical protein CC78DRAFT_568121 [Didymosphaeria enalia]